MSRLTEAGHTLLELLVATTLLLLLVLVGALLVHETAGLTTRLPRQADMRQQARIALDQIARDVRGAGMAPELVPAVDGALGIPAVWPRRLGRSADAPGTARSGVITTLIVPLTIAQTLTTGAISAADRLLPAATWAHCGPVIEPCGFTRGQLVAVTGASGHFSLFSVEGIEAGGVLATPVSQAVDPLPAGAAMYEVRLRGYLFEPAEGTVRQFGPSTSAVLITGVSDFSIDYYGETGRLPVEVFGDGPWAGSGATRFDVDLLRVRRLRLTLRLVSSTDSFGAMIDVMLRNRPAAGGPVA